MTAVCIFKKVEKIIEKKVGKIIQIEFDDKKYIDEYNKNNREEIEVIKIEFFDKKYIDEINKNNREEIEAFYEQSKDSLLFITQKAVAS